MKQEHSRKSFYELKDIKNIFLFGKIVDFTN